MDVFIYEKVQYMLAPPDLGAQIERLKEDLLIERECNLRVIADFRNYRRHVENDVHLLVKESQQGMITPILDIINDMQKLYLKDNLSVINML